MKFYFYLKTIRIVIKQLIVSIAIEIVYEVNEFRNYLYNFK